MRLLRSYGISLVLLLWAAAVAGAQMTAAVISGSVKDESASVLPGATIDVRNVGTGISRTVVTDERGHYRVPSLPLGDYSVQATLTGFGTAVRTGITLGVGREAIVDLVLKVGEISEQVVVTGDAPTVQTTSSALRSLVDQHTIENLPLNGRNYMQLAVLQPATHQMLTGGTTAARPQSASTGMGLRFSTGGARDKQNLYLFDGIQQTDVTGSTPGSVAGVSYGVDTIREFEILTSAYSAEYGGRAGGVVNVVSRSGTNRLHGSAFLFHRNDALDARNFFDPVDDKPKLLRNQFGVTVEGPIFKDKTFFIASYEGFRERSPRTINGLVPTEAARRGVLPSGTVTVSPLMRAYLDLYPMPNGRDFGDGTAEYVAPTTVPVNETFVTGKIDHHFSSNHRFAGRFSMTDGTSNRPAPLLQMADLLGVENTHASFEHVSILTPALLMTHRFGVNLSDIIEKSVELRNFDFPNLYFVPESGQFGIIVVPGLSDLWGKGGGGDRDSVVNVFQYAPQLVYSRGRHSTKIGVDFRQYVFTSQTTRRNGGEVNFPSLSALLSGRPSRARGSLPGSDPAHEIHQKLLAFYAQDDFSWSSSVTLNLGLRYEFVTLPFDTEGRLGSLIDPLTATGFTLGPLFGSNPSLKNFSPRIGLAWDPSGEGLFAVRSGFAMLYDEILPNYYTQEVNNTPLTPTGLGRVDGDRRNPPFPLIWTGFSAKDLPILDQRMTTIDYHPKQPIRYHYQLDVERQLGGEFVVRMGYIGSQSRNQSRRYATGNTRVPTVRSDGRLSFVPGSPRRNPNLGPIQFKDFEADGVYNAVHVGMRRRVADGLGFQANYTWGKSIDEGSVSFDQNENQQASDLPNPADPSFERGLSDYHVGHSFSASFIWELPFGSDKPFLSGASRPVLAFVSGWQINGVIRLASGAPFHPVIAYDYAGMLSTEPDTQRPDLAAGASNSPVLGGPDKYFDPTAFVLPPAGTLGNLGRNTIIGPGLAVVDASLIRNFGLGAARSFQFRLEAFNLFNRANFALPSRDIFSASGRLGSAGRIIATTTTARQVQLGLKFLF